MKPDLKYQYYCIQQWGCNIHWLIRSLFMEKLVNSQPPAMCLNKSETFTSSLEIE